MAQNNANKVFAFAIEIDGIDQFLFQDVKVPEIEIGSVEHGATNYNVKSAGGVAVSDAELQKLVAAPTADSWAWDWLNLAQDMNAGTGGLTETYYKNVVFKELSPAGATVNSWLWTGCWVKKIAKSNFKRGKQDENTIETVTLSVNRVRKLI